MSYIKDNFLLTNKTAEKLYVTYAKDMPIFDYHCHLPEKQILANNSFNDIFEIWLAGDHYKWRLMRNYGIDEEYITGNKSNKEKFLAYCKVLGTAFGNPLYHWSQVELKEYFNCEIEINESNAELIWDWCNEYIKLNKITPQSLIEKSNVTHIFTTNEIFDDLTTFTKIAQKDYKFKVIPAFRADKIMNVEANGYTETIKKLQALCGEIKNLDDLEKAIENRLLEFIKVGTTASDIALQSVYPVSEKSDADAVFQKAISGNKVSETDAETFKGYFTYFLFKLYAKYDIRTELHIGAMRNNNSIMLEKLGLDFDVENSITLEELREMSRDELEKSLMSIEDFFKGLEKVRLNPFFSTLALNGAHIYLSKIKLSCPLTPGQRALMYTSDNKFFALGEVIETDEGQALKPIKMFGTD